MKHSSNIGPAQKVGKMRVSRKPIKRHDNTSTDNMKKPGDLSATATPETSDEVEEGDHVDDNNNTSDLNADKQHDNNEDKKVNHTGGGGLDCMHKRGFQARNLYDLQSHIASREPAVVPNPGTNVKQIYISNAQPRGTSH